MSPPSFSRSRAARAARTSSSRARTPRDSAHGSRKQGRAIAVSSRSRRSRAPSVLESSRSASIRGRPPSPSILRLTAGTSAGATTSIREHVAKTTTPHDKADSPVPWYLAAPLPRPGSTPRLSAWAPPASRVGRQPRVRGRYRLPTPSYPRGRGGPREDRVSECSRPYSAFSGARHRHSASEVESWRALKDPGQAPIYTYPGRRTPSSIAPPQSIRRRPRTHGGVHSASSTAATPPREPDGQQRQVARVTGDMERTAARRLG